MSENPWVRFLKDNKNSGKTLAQLRMEYMSPPTGDADADIDADADTNTDRPVYQYDDDADLKHNSLMEQIKADKRLFPDGLCYINAKLENKDEVTPDEEYAWRSAFELALTDEYTLTKERLCNEDSWWINRLKQVMEPDDIYEIVDEAKQHNHDDIYAFLDDLLPRFTIEQLYVIGHPDMDD
jgi:hypothetical protein